MQTSIALSQVHPESGGCLRTPAWDLTFVSLSAVLVVVPYACYHLLIAAGVAGSTSATFADLMVTLLVAGPHMYATFTRTISDPAFRANHRRIIATSLALPILVFAVGLTAFPILLIVFFF